MESADITGKDSRKYLIVDDHAGFRRTIRAFLPRGDVCECADGRDVVARYTEEHPDWVLMDIEMRDMDGLTATRHLKEQFPEARVIFVSHHGEDDFKIAARDLGAYGFVKKDHLEELAAIIIDGDMDRRKP